MATTYKQAFARANAGPFQQRVRMALARAAGDVVGETTSGAGALRDKRHDHGVTVLHGLDRNEMVQRYSLAVVMEPALMNVDQAAGEVTGDEIADAVLFTNVKGMFNRFAGVKNGET